MHVAGGSMHRTCSEPAHSTAQLSAGRSPADSPSDRALRCRFAAGGYSRQDITTSTVHELDRPDAIIRYWLSGSPGSSSQPTVVLLHGATLDHRAWDRQVDALRDRFPLVVPDLRAHGQSTGSFAFAAAVDDVRHCWRRCPPTS
jgi:pimeloyl-ACP methyl ester carboxylesterase